MEIKNKILKKCLPMMLSLMLVLTMMPLIPGAVQKVEAADTEAAESVVSELNLNYDMDVIELNTAWTEGEVKERLRENISIATDGVRINKINSWLKYKNEDGVLFAAGDGTDQVKPDQTYYIQYCLELLDGYVWPEGVSEDDYSAFTVKVNGVEKTSEVAEFSRNPYYNSVYVTISIGEATEEPIVRDVTISGGNVSVAKGMDYYFAGEVHGTVDIDKILWSVEGKTSSATKIVEDKGRGHLTVGEDETAETIIVKATALANQKKYATVTVTITEKPPTIDSVTVTPDNAEILQGASQKFYADVRGTQADKSVTWSVENAESDNTTIDQNGKLIVGSDETAETIIVKATANRDSEKSGTATVTVKKGISVNELNLTYDLNVIDLNVLSKEGEVQSRIRNTINTTTEGVKVNTSNSWLMYKLEGGNFIGIGDGTNFVKADQIYYIEYGLEIPEGYRWPDGVIEEDYSGLTVKVNGVDKTEEVADFSINTFTGMLYVTVPIVENLNRAEVVLSSTSYTYDGTAKTPEVTVKDGDKTLVNGTDYEVTYSNNINAGTAKVTIIGKGNYTGTITKTFTIAKQAYSSKFKTTLSTTKYTYNGEVKKPSVTVYNAAGKKLVNGTDYDVTYASGRKSVGRYKVTINFKGNYSGSKALYFTIVPKAPSSAKAALTYYYGQTAGYDDVRFSWSKVTGASGYTVYYKKSTSSGYTYLKRTTGTSVRVKDLSDGAKYYFKVVPYYKSGDTRYASLSYKTASVYTLKKVATPTVTKSGTKVKVKWTNISGESGYQISRSTSKTGTNIVYTYGTTSGTYKAISATKGKTYYYKVRAYKTIKENGKTKSVYGPWSYVKAYKRK